ncbi:NUDIX hydrolase [Rhodococcus sp. NPDC060086]|uniref:NUDIX hydrolase n=1 Tax=Rhodococcus sp. NPDC060086 TaxID=3347055 RepID=UPI0036509598
MSSIRNLSVGLPIRSGHVLVLDGVDRVTGEAFHRAIGGGIEFGETAETALRREFTEELGVTLGATELLAVVENIFEYEGNRGHEIVHVFAVDSVEIDAIPWSAQLRVLDEGSPIRWVSIAEANRPFYPTGVADILDTLLRESSS